MKINIRAAIITLALAVVATSHAANTPLTATGFNADLVVENTPSHFAHAADGSNLFDSTHPAWFESGLGGHADGLPASGSITSLAGTLFQLQPYGINGVASNNALRLFDGATATLTLSTPVQLSSLSILASTASGGSTSLPLVIHFTDGSTFSTSFSAPDWVAPANGIDGLARSGVSGTGFTYDTAGGNDFGMTETIIDLSSTTKLVDTLTFTGANTFTTYTTTSIFAVSGSVVPEPTSCALLMFGVAFCLRRRTLRTT